MRIATTEPVQLVNCTLAGAGDLIVSGEGANLIVRNCRGYGLEPSRTGVGRGRFVNSYRARRLWIEHNYFEQTSGLNIDRWSTSGGVAGVGQPLLVRYNQARNIDGRWRGNQGSTRASFVILNTVRSLPGVEISYNEVRNTANQSLVEDNINLYASSGTSSSPIRVHNNFVFGAYPFPATGTGYTGTGMTTDGNGNASEVTAFVEAYENQFVSTCNAAMNIAAGHDIYYHDNRLVTSGLLADGTRLPSTWAGTSIFNYYKLPGNVFFNNRVERTVVGYMSKGGQNGRQDVSPGACASCAVEALPNPVTVDTERGEDVRWQQKLQQRNITVGPEDGDEDTTPSVPAPSTGSNYVVNPSFDADGRGTESPTGWQTWTGNGTGTNASYTETYPTARTGTYHGTHYRPGSYEVYTYQTLRNLPAGQYTLRAWVKGAGGQNAAQMRVMNYGGSQRTVSIGATNGGVSGNWTQVEIRDIAVSKGECEIGFYSNAGGGGQWIYFDDVEFVAQSGTPAVPNVFPKVGLSATVNNLTLGNSLTLTANTGDSDGSIRKVEFYSGTTKIGEKTSAPYQLSWKPVGIGTLSLTAVATDDDGATTTSSAVTVTVVGTVVLPTPSAPAPSTGSNYVVNPSFDADGRGTESPTGWQTWTGNGTGTNASYTETYPTARTGTYHGTHYRPGSYEVYTYQTLRNLPAGQYTLRAWVKGAGGQNAAQMLVKNYGGSQRTVSIGATNGGVSGNWTQVEIRDITVSKGECEIGFYSNADGGGQWIYFDDVEFVAQTSGGTSEGSNTVLNASFDDNLFPTQTPSRWSTTPGNGSSDNADYTEIYPGAHSGLYHATHYRPEAYEVYTYQMVSGLADGTYTLRVWAKCSGGQNTVQLQARNYGGAARTANIGANNNWTQIEISGIQVTNGQCEVGVYSKAGAGGQWLYFDDVELVRVQNSFSAVSSSNSTVSGLSVTGAESNVAASVTEFSVFPNPANVQTTIAAPFEQAGSVTISILNLQGQEIAHYVQSVVSGSNYLPLSTANLPIGNYVLRVAGPGHNYTKRLVISR
ncbi:T9SS type A sorting domain-containing protein [Hymenobacter sp. NBH84]|uniref:T9SS type A sorting domain-containing protein n=1 Tax=Hymenobacter sp. NBH84 TaxID=2596915 RepID=UPI0016275C4D|nr:Ig-like domain-containing protein [Hymenobacter sp. NBH84]QNE38687.1 T9SS type A sorting domain-containing protein [Hymenobacter sp. NBH84]